MFFGEKNKWQTDFPKFETAKYLRLCIYQVVRGGAAARSVGDLSWLIRQDLLLLFTLNWYTYFIQRHKRRRGKVTFYSPTGYKMLY